MTTELNKQVVRRWYEEVLSTGDLDALEQIISPDYVQLYDGVPQLSGWDGARQHVQSVRRLYADLTVTIDRQIAEGDWVASQLTMRGRHAGELVGIAPTGQVIEVKGVNVDQVKDGRIVAHDGAANLLWPLLKLGAVRPSSPGAEASGADDTAPVEGTFRFTGKIEVSDKPDPDVSDKPDHDVTDGGS